jgi:hypothetical protein
VPFPVPSVPKRVPAVPFRVPFVPSVPFLVFQPATKALPHGRPLVYYLHNFGAMRMMGSAHTHVRIGLQFYAILGSA